MGEDLPQRRTRLWRILRERADRIVEREPAFLGALHDERRREELGDAVNLEGRVGPGGDGALEVDAAVRLFPGAIAVPDDRGRQPRDSGLAAEGVQVVAE